MIDQQASALPEQAKRREGVRISLILALLAGLFACLLAASYIVRTPLVLGPLVGERLAHLADLHDVDLQVNSIRPVGLTGLRLEQVQVVARRGSYLVHADLDTVDINPSIDDLVSNLRVHPDAIEVNGGRIHIMRAPAPSPKPPAEPVSTPPPPSETAMPAVSEGAEQVEARSTRAILHDVSVSVSPAPLPGTTRPLVLHRADLVVTTGGHSGLDFRHGYGLLPDDTPFAVRQQDGADGPDTYIVEPERPTRLDRWFAGPLPAGLSVAGVTVCPECEPATADLQELRLLGPAGLTATSKRMQISASKREARVSFAEISAKAHGEALPYSLRDLEVVYDAETSTAIVQGDVLDGDDGLASFASNWSGQWGVLETNIQLRDFHTGRLWALAGMGRHVRGGVHTGKLETSYEPWMDLLELSVDVDTRGLILELPVVTDDPLEFGKLSLELQAVFQPRARTLSVPSGNARLGDADPIHFGGYAIDAWQGWAFEAHASAEDLHPQRLRDGVPPTLAKLARGTQFDGEFGFDIRSAGHTGFPESITLTVDFSGDVDVQGDSSYADVLALAADGPPSINLPGTLAQNVGLDAWIDYDSLPEHVPQVLTAAEDAKFFSHDGFDWRGLRRALVHNVKEGGIERGGSTLSQQLSKNLFLDHERTLARKLQEAYVTWRLESELSKERILELYMNLVEWGPNIQGLKQAARRYFGVAPTELTIPQVALLASVLPGPSLFGQQVLSGYLPSSRVEKIEHILSNLRYLQVISGREYRTIYRGAKKGEIGGLELTVCDDDGKAAEGTPKCR